MHAHLVPHTFLHVCMLCMCLCVRFSGSVPGMRPAEAGEFTRRAFQAGKMGLTEVGQEERVEMHRDRSVQICISIAFRRNFTG